MAEHDIHRNHSERYRRLATASAEKGLYRSLIISISAAAVGALQFLLIPIANVDGNIFDRLFAYLLAGILWISVIAQIFITFTAKKEREKLQAKGYRIRGIMSSPVGAFSFFKNKEGGISDVVLFASAIFLAIVIWTGLNSYWLVYICLFLLFLSFNYHCIFNGRNYRYNKALKNFKKEQKKDE